jgi:acyl carrier protein
VTDQTSTAAERTLLDHIARTWMDGDADGLDVDSPIIDLNIIDSAAIFDLVHYLQSQFRITVPLTEVSPANFGSVRAVARLVDRLAGDGPAELARASSGAPGQRPTEEGA